MAKKMDLVVFDMAGTTVNDEDGVNRCVRDALRLVGVDALRDAVNEVMGIPKPLALSRLLERSSRRDLMGQLDAIHADFVARMIRFYETDPSVHEIAGATDVFRMLRSAGILVVLDTGFSRDIVQVLMRRLRWEDRSLVNLTVASDDVPNGRPHPDMVLKAMHDLGVTDAGRVAKVGDTPADLQEGHAARCGMVVGVTGGTHTAEQLRPFRPTHLIGSVVELPALVES